MRENREPQQDDTKHWLKVRKITEDFFLKFGTVVRLFERTKYAHMVRFVMVEKYIYNIKGFIYAGKRELNKFKSAHNNIRSMSYISNTYSYNAYAPMYLS